MSDSTADHGLRPSNVRLKRLFDLTVLIAAHVVLLPVWAVLWSAIPLLIWLDDHGPIFYRQRRAGLNRVEIEVLKFRTMVPDADRRGPAWTQEGDRRITRTGAFLRKTALDELPQVLSIWKGDLSFVGPRALAVNEQAVLEDTIPGFGARLAIRPGLTGMAQVYGRRDDSESKLEMDLDYIQRSSLLLDLKLILLSVRNTLFARWDSRGGVGTSESKRGR